MVLFCKQTYAGSSCSVIHMKPVRDGGMESVLRPFTRDIANVTFSYANGAFSVDRLPGTPASCYPVHKESTGCFDFYGVNGGDLKRPPVFEELFNYVRSIAGDIDFSTAEEPPSMASVQDRTQYERIVLPVLAITGHMNRVEHTEQKGPKFSCDVDQALTAILNQSDAFRCLAASSASTKLLFVVDKRPPVSTDRASVIRGSRASFTFLTPERFFTSVIRPALSQSPRVWMDIAMSPDHARAWEGYRESFGNEACELREFMRTVVFRLKYAKAGGDRPDILDLQRLSRDLNALASTTLPLPEPKETCKSVVVVRKRKLPVQSTIVPDRHSDGESRD